MRAKERRKNGAYAAPEERLDDAEGSRALGNRARDALIVGAKLLQRADQPIRLADHASAGFVGGVLALARDAELEHQRGDRSKNQHQDRSEATASSALVIAAPPTI